MRFHPFEVSETHIVYACFGGFVVLFSMFSTLAKEKFYVGEVVFATLFGIALGPSGANVFRPRDWGSSSDQVTNEITLEVTRIVLALGVFAIGVELPKSYMAIHWKSLSLMVIPVMFFGYVSSAGLLVAIFPSLSYLSALVISACLTPTDPILAAAIVGGAFADKNVPRDIRQLLAAESAANDGLAYPFLFLPLYLTLDATTGEAMKDFIGTAIFYQVVLGVISGSVLGYIFSKTMRFMERKGFIGADSYVVQFVAMVVFIEGVVTMMGSDDLLACFAAGSAISWDGHFNEQTEENAVFATLIESIMNCVVFVFIGAWIRFPDWTNAAIGLSPARLAGFFFSILFIRRIPPLLLLYRTIPEIRTWREALFCGWFGPMGVGAVFISTLALTYLPQPTSNPETQTEVLATFIQPVVAFTILGSIIIHGLSIPVFSLARTVNTLSRTTTMNTSQPEWMNQTQRISISPEHTVSVTDAVPVPGRVNVDPSSEVLTTPASPVSPTAAGNKEHPDPAAEPRFETPRTATPPPPAPTPNPGPPYDDPEALSFTRTSTLTAGAGAGNEKRTVAFASEVVRRAMGAGTVRSRTQSREQSPSPSRANSRPPSPVHQG